MAQLMEHMKKDHEREDFVHTESNTYRSHFIVQSSDFTREIMWISDHIVLGNFTQSIEIQNIGKTEIAPKKSTQES